MKKVFIAILIIILVLAGIFLLKTQFQSKPVSEETTIQISTAVEDEEETDVSAESETNPPETSDKKGNEDALESVEEEEEVLETEIILENGEKSDGM